MLFLIRLRIIKKIQTIMIRTISQTGTLTAENAELRKGLITANNAPELTPASMSVQTIFDRSWARKFLRKLTGANSRRYPKRQADATGKIDLTTL